MGMYKVCWCGGVGDCTLDEHFSMHVASLIINGMILTVAGNGQTPNRTSDMIDGAPGVQQPLSSPWGSLPQECLKAFPGVAVADTRVFFSERETHVIRYMEIEEGQASASNEHHLDFTHIQIDHRRIMAYMFFFVYTF